MGTFGPCGHFLSAVGDEVWVSPLIWGRSWSLTTLLSNHRAGRVQWSLAPLSPLPCFWGAGLNWVTELSLKERLSSPPLPAIPHQLPPLDQTAPGCRSPGRWRGSVRSKNLGGKQSSALCPLLVSQKPLSQPPPQTPKA